MSEINCQILGPDAALLCNVSVADWSACKKHLQYVDYAVQTELNRLLQNYQWKRTDPKNWENKKRQLETKLIVPTYVVKPQKETVSSHEQNILCRPGSLHLLEQCCSLNIINNNIKYPKMCEDIYVWKRSFPFRPHHYQEEAVRRLLQKKHGHVEICTGAGKSHIILNLVQKTGLKCGVIVPGKENFKTLVSEFQDYFGADQIGMFGDGKKCLGKPITICIGKSLSLLKKDKDEAAWAYFAGLDVIIVDESHTWGAQSMSKVCYGVLAKVPYRFFLSATQVRSDEEDNLLFSIIGPCVHALGTAEAVRCNYINAHVFEIYKNISPTRSEEQQKAMVEACPMHVRRIAFLYNDTIAELIAARTLRDFAQHKASLILVDEVGQIGLLIAKFKSIDQTFNVDVNIAFAHGETNNVRLQSLQLPKNTPKSMERAVDDMNKGKKLIMIATGCVQTGASFFTPHTCYNFVGGGAKNRIRTLQGAVGRAVRKWNSNPFKKHLPPYIVQKEVATIVDFDVNHKQLQKHLAKRYSYYALSGTSINYIDT